MGLLAALIPVSLKAKFAYSSKEQYIFYKIVDFNERDEAYKLQCINTTRTFYATLLEIIADNDILYGLHPIQACFIGLEYAKLLRNIDNNIEINTLKSNLENYTGSRYGKYRVIYQKTKGITVFIDKSTEETYSQDARDLALSAEYIKEFDAIDAFFIGQEAGRLLISPQRTVDKDIPTKPKLTLVKK